MTFFVTCFVNTRLNYKTNALYFLLCELDCYCQFRVLGISIVDISNATAKNPAKINCTGASDTETVTWIFEDLSLRRRNLVFSNVTLSIFSSKDVGNYSCSYANTTFSDPIQIQAISNFT